ncbi:D-glycerate dehydrogenase [Chryseobacterium indologenes]|uniref:2-hydroxyacid dehydrogenase n=1 Tax=Chryseobacterium indologenes TaxID=253 RepID=UPI000F4F3FFA|nr:D-glycerate dehydrogenase [Chryseobacterium indologenes]AYZ35288.1 D-glycerate dehydrogenase [Chryseobacterium indologenes]MBF6644023.1 D-glycerate dehydrogenase [Chryseobacterium indologenes]MBU3049438.1 D-glycerate dehydrogenase [Chryseobacterium indologenes]MEB4761381.1 D-glycerate dehydrogenase [Chryseobacterium indologenes]QQQ72252.1 D-glycerate dehydrogenase [Chryseobacterium indologenes]
MKVFVNKMIPEIGMNLLKQAGLEVILPENENLTQEEWLQYCRSVDVILSIGNDFKYDKKFFDTCQNIKAIALYSVGFDHVDINEAVKRNIPVGNTPDVLSRATSDVAFLLMQAVARKASYNFQKVKNGNWGSFDPLHALGQELYGKTLGIFGLGRIGFEMAKKSKHAFDMNIIYHNRNRNEEAEKELGAIYVSFEELITSSDVLSIHASFTPEHKELFNEEVFKKMKSNAIFVNTARGGFQNQKDLYQALTDGTIWGAGLDVTNPEPMSSDDPMLELSNVCVLPHIGSATMEARNGMARLAAENLIAFSRGEKMPYCANPEVYSHHS